jgi:hypothetical protein
MEPLLTRKFNSYSEAFAGYLASALIPRNDKDASVSFVRYPNDKSIIHLHKIQHRIDGSLSLEGYVVFKFIPGQEGITMLLLNPDDTRHFANLMHSNGNLNYEMIERMIELLPQQVEVGMGASCWPKLREVFLSHVYGTVEQST